MSAMKKGLLIAGSFCCALIAIAKQIDIPAGESATGKQAISKNGAVAAEDSNNSDLVVVRKPIPFETVYELTRTVAHGRKTLKSQGKNGELIEKYRFVEQDGKKVKELVSKERIEPVPHHYLVGKPRFELSRGSYTRSKVITMHASAYDPSAGRGAKATFRTSTGMRAQMGVAAVDPRFIKMGTVLFVEGYGLALAADRGSAIKGNRIDLCYPTRSQALQFGRRTVKVHILG